MSLADSALPRCSPAALRALQGCYMAEMEALPMVDATSLAPTYHLDMDDLRHGRSSIYVGATEAYLKRFAPYISMLDSPAYALLLPHLYNEVWIYADVLGWAALLITAARAGSAAYIVVDCDFSRADVVAVLQLWKAAFGAARARIEDVGAVTRLVISTGRRVLEFIDTRMDETAMLRGVVAENAAMFARVE